MGENGREWEQWQQRREPGVGLVVGRAGIRIVCVGQRRGKENVIGSDGNLEQEHGALSCLLYTSDAADE